MHVLFKIGDVMEHKKCKGCRWNNYPICEGIIMSTGEFMNIDKLRSSFRCGQKELDVIDDHTPKKSDLELRIEALEEKTKDLTEVTK